MKIIKTIRGSGTERRAFESGAGAGLLQSMRPKRTRSLINTTLHGGQPKKEPTMKLSSFGICRAQDLSTSIRIPVVAIGWQETCNGEDVFLINDPAGSTHVYDPERHVIVDDNGMDLTRL